MQFNLEWLWSTDVLYIFAVLIWLKIPKIKFGTIRMKKSRCDSTSNSVSQWWCNCEVKLQERRNSAELELHGIQNLFFPFHSHLIVLRSLCECRSVLSFSSIFPAKRRKWLPKHSNSFPACGLTIRTSIFSFKNNQKFIVDKVTPLWQRTRQRST